MLCFHWKLGDILVGAVQSLSCVQLFVTPWTVACQASSSFTISLSFLKVMSVESVMTSNCLILCHALMLLPSIFPNINVFSSESALHIRWSEYWSFSFNVSPSNEYSGLMYLELTDLIFLLSKGLSRVFSNAAAQRHQFFGAQPFFFLIVHLSHPYMTTGKNIALTILTFVGKVVCFLTCYLGLS